MASFCRPDLRQRFRRKNQRWEIVCVISEESLTACHMNSVNLKQLALELNLSVSTVSRALRDSWEISTPTKQRVFDLAKKMNFQPNPYASSLRKHRSRTIAVV